MSNEALLILGKEWENLIDQTDSVLLYDIKEKKLTTLVEQKNLMISRAVFADGKIVMTATDGKPYGEIVQIARDFIADLGGFEAFAEWGLF